MTWTTITLEVTTPLFNGGANGVDGQPGDAGFRIPSLRGAMRFWFRALAGIGVGANLPGLATVENSVFGSTDHSSPVKFRLAGQPPICEPGKPDWCRGDDGRWIVYLLGQGLGDLRKVEVTRRYIAPGETVRLQLRLGDDADIAALVLASLWLTCTYGGLGARTRRGFGGLRITDVDGDLPTPWTAERLRTPNLEIHQNVRALWPAGALGACMPIVIRVVRDRCQVPFTLTSEPDRQPLYPVLSRTYAPAGLLGGEHFVSWTSLLAHTGEQLRHFRASRDTPGVPYRPAVKTPEWLDVVRDDDTAFGLGALGLPVVFKDGYLVNAFDRRTGESLRRASPLWLRPVGGDRHWRLLSYAFRSQFLPETAEIRLDQKGRRVKVVTVTDADVTARTTAWITNLRGDVDLTDR